jgi:hypothetical protein
MAKTISARPPKSPGRTNIEKRLPTLERDGASAAEVMKALSDAGIRDLEELVRRVIGRSVVRPEPIDLFGAPPQHKEPRKDITRKPPKIAFTVGNVTYDPRDIKRFDGQALCLVPRRSASGEDELLGFVGSEWLRSLMDYFRMVRIASLAPGGASPSHRGSIGIQTQVGAGKGYNPNRKGEHTYVGPPSVDFGHEVPSLIARFYVDPSFEGDSTWLAGNRQVPDLTKFSRGFWSLLDWNDVISSLQTDGATLVLYSDINYQDHDTLVVMPTLNYASLGLYGWDDRVSSIQNFGEIY